MLFKEFQEYEAFTDSLVDMQSRYMIPKLDRRRWAIHRVQFGGINLQYVDEGGGKIVQGVVRSGGYLLYGQIGGTSGRVEGVESTPDHVVLMAPEADFCIACPDAHSWYSVFLPKEHLKSIDQIEKTTDKRTKKSSSPSKKGDAAKKLVFVHKDPERSESIRQIVRKVLSVLGTAPINDEPALKDKIIESIVGHTREILSLQKPESEQTLGRPMIDRDAILESIFNWTETTSMQEQAKADLKSLAAVAKVSERTLRTVFVERYNVPPAKYLRLLRFRNARKALKEAVDMSKTVSVIAVDNGFWDFGRFAIDYRKLYGERPSETLARSIASSQDPDTEDE